MKSTPKLTWSLKIFKTSVKNEEKFNQQQSIGPSLT